MKFHTVADIFPMMSPEEYESLKADIKQNGLLQPIWTHENQIIDGRNRYNACEDLGVVPAYKEWDGNGSLVAFVVSLNLQRRHLDSGQKAFVALEVERLLAEEARERQREALRQGNITKHLDSSISQNFEQSTNETVSQKFNQREELKTTGQRVVDDLEKLIEDEMVGPIVASMAREKALEQIDDPDLTATGCLLLASDEYQYGASNYDNRPNFLSGQGVFIEEKNEVDETLSLEQKTIIASETEKKLTVANKNHHNQNKATEQAARIVGSNRQYVQDAKFIQEKAPDVAEAVKSGTIKIYEAKKVAVLPEDQRRVVIEKVQSGEKPSQAIHEAKQQDKVSKTTWTESELKRKELVERGYTVTAHQNNDVQLIAWAEANKKFVRIDRFSDWGNPFLLPGDGDRKTVIAHYKQYLLWRPTLIKRLDELKGKVLGCWCHPEECHGDAIIEVMLDDNPF